MMIMGRLSEWMGCVFMDEIPNKYARDILYSRINDKALMEARKLYRPIKRKVSPYEIYVDKNFRVRERTVENPTDEYKSTNKLEVPWRE